MATQRKGAPNTEPALSPEEARVLDAVLAAIRQVRYGEVKLVLQDGKVVQIERLERERFVKP